MDSGREYYQKSVIRARGIIGEDAELLIALNQNLLFHDKYFALIACNPVYELPTGIVRNVPRGYLVSWNGDPLPDGTFTHVPFVIVHGRKIIVPPFFTKEEIANW
jgi:hypothetical protein